MIERPEYQKHDNHLTVYLAWPLLAGLGLAIVLSISAAGLAMFFSRFDWSKVGMAAGLTFFGVLGGGTLAVFWYAAHEWAGPRTAERIARPVQVVTQARPEEPRPPMVINRYNEPPMLPAGSMDVEIDPLVADAAPEVMELYNFITQLWPGGDISRKTAREHGFDRAVWERLIGGVRGKEGMESGRGHLDRAGVVVHTGKGWQIAASLDQAYAINADLLAYAQARAEIVTGRDGRDGTGQDRVANPVPRGAGRGGKRGA
jgi:hypothetical protein